MNVDESAWTDLEGVVLAFELDESTTPGLIDTAIVELRLAGTLNQVATIVFGRVSAGCGITTAVLDEVLLRRTATAPVPIVADLPLGPAGTFGSWPFDVLARVGRAEGPKSELLEPAVLRSTYACP